MSAGDPPPNMRVNDATGEVYFNNWFDTTTVPTPNYRVYSITYEQAQIAERRKVLNEVKRLIHLYRFTSDEIKGIEE